MPDFEHIMSNNQDPYGKTSKIILPTFQNYQQKHLIVKGYNGESYEKRGW